LAPLAPLRKIYRIDRRSPVNASPRACPAGANCHNMLTSLKARVKETGECEVISLPMVFKVRGVKVAKGGVPGQ